MTRPDRSARGGDDEGASEPLSPTGAFSLLAHETRLTAMRALWTAEEPLRFSEITTRGDISDTGNFNYHFGKLVGHFVRKRGERYELTRAGRQAMTAVLVGDVTERPTFEPVTLDERCPYCGARVELHHDADVLRVVCAACPGTFAGDRAEVPATPNPHGTITTFDLPPAGLADRDPAAVLDAALVRLASRVRDMANGVCPACAGPVERTVRICSDHDAGDGLCADCGARFAGIATSRCRTCRHTHAGMLALVGLADTRVRRFFVDRGFDPLAPDWAFALAFLGVEERVPASDDAPYEAVWTVDDDTLHMRVDEGGELLAVEVRDGGDGTAG